MREAPPGTPGDAVIGAIGGFLSTPVIGFVGLILGGNGRYGTLFVWLAALLVDAALLTASFALPSWRRAKHRTFFLGFGFALLGGLAVCDAFTIRSLLPA